MDLESHTCSHSHSLAWTRDPLDLPFHPSQPCPSAHWVLNLYLTPLVQGGWGTSSWGLQSGHGQSTKVEKTPLNNGTQRCARSLSVKQEILLFPIHIFTLKIQLISLMTVSTFFYGFLWHSLGENLFYLSAHVLVGQSKKN